ncbi:MAG TPA: hypothetical protein VMA73_30265 [Streptosporangiaceae bacterium]|nr:hypothetical protein [Streptosporangiaceae bacterium]
MSSQIEDELRVTFEAASDFVQPRSALADRVRSATRRRRRRLTTGFAATACVLVAAGSAYVAAHSHSSLPAAGQQGRVLVTVPRGDSLVWIGVSGRYLYAEMGPKNGPFSVAAYNRASGRLVSRVVFPKADELEPYTGPGGSVWVVVGQLGYFGQRPVKTWLLSPDLRLRSIGPKVASTFLEPVSRTTALIPVEGGLLELTMPPPGRPGHATEQREPGTGLGHAVMTTGLGWATVLDGRVAVDLPDNDGYDYHVVIAGHPGVKYGNANTPQPAAVAGDSLWFANGLGRPLVRLNGQLKPTTPGFVAADPVLKHVGAADILDGSGLWSADATIWVASLDVRHSLASARHSLMCFPAQSQDGPVVTMPVHGYVWGLAEAGQTVYLTTSRSLNGTPTSVTSYPVPAACR